VPRLGPNTITTLPELLAELEQVRRNGYATTWEELEAGLCSTAAPVRGTRGTVIAAISISAPTVRTTRERLAELTKHVVRVADALTDHISNHKDEGNVQ
jgi:DNA-binding IclR family transcriptional regulator